jgi:hypothetical protein
MEDKFLNPIRRLELSGQNNVSKNWPSSGVKLTNTVYKLLEFFPESDPLKNRAKDKALAIMEHLTLLNENSAGLRNQGWASFHDLINTPKVKMQILENIDTLLGYLWIGKSQSWLNSVNCLIIANEYEKIKKEVGLITEPITEFTQKLPGIEEKSNQKLAGGNKQENKKEASFEPFNPVLDNKKPGEAVLTELEPINSGPDSWRDKAGTLARQAKIIEFLGKNEKAQVMDLQTILPDITKRTIRRDLDELLGTGKIIRLGDFNQVFYKIV